MRIEPQSPTWCKTLLYLYKNESVGFAFAHPTCRGSRIAQIVETDNAESPRMVYIKPIRVQPCTKQVRTRHITAGYNIPTVGIYWLPPPFDDFVICEITTCQGRALSKRPFP